MPFRHVDKLYVEGILTVPGLNYLSAQCPFGTIISEDVNRLNRVSVSITFRLSALSAPVSARRRKYFVASLNYLSAQCPFGTSSCDINGDAARPVVSITFRLSALSAR